MCRFPPRSQVDRLSVVIVEQSEVVLAAPAPASVQNIERDLCEARILIWIADAELDEAHQWPTGERDLWLAESVLLKQCFDDPFRERRLGSAVRPRQDVVVGAPGEW